MSFKNHTFILILSFVFTFHLNNNAQDTGTLRGLVTDSLTAEALPFCNAYIKELGKGAVSDKRGYFLIHSIPANKSFTLVVSYVGYQTKFISIRVTDEKLTHVDIKLNVSGIQLKTIEQIGERYQFKDNTKISVQRIVSKEFEMLPKSVEMDIFHNIKYLPGVQSTSDVSAKYYVRGGANNQNLVLFDGITIYNPFHALGLFGIVDPDIVSSIEFYKGGFAAEFGGRLSSVMSINSKDGDKNSLGATASASLMSAKLLLEGPIPNGSFIISGRKSYSTAILDKFFSDSNIPVDFYDLSMKANFSSPEFMPGAKFTLNAMVSGDNITNSNPKVEDYKWSNSLFGLRWLQVPDSPLFFELAFTASGFNGSLIKKESEALSKENKVTDFGFEINFNYIFDSKDEIVGGFHVREITTTLNQQNELGIPIDYKSAGTGITFFTKYKFLRLDMLDLDIGTRINAVKLVKNKNTATFEPRLNIKLRPFSNLALTGAVGFYQQEITTLSSEYEVINFFEPWVLNPVSLDAQKSTHYIAGIEYSPIEELFFTVETYYKKTDNYPILNNKKVLISDPDFIKGINESYGVEFYNKSKIGFMNVMISYTYAFSYKEIDQLRYYNKFDVRHQVNAHIDLNLGDGWTFGTNWVFHSGLPFTKIIGYYDKFYLDDIFNPEFNIDPRKPISILGVDNLHRLPQYHKLDITLTKKLNISFADVTLDLSIINVYDRKNIFYFKRDTGERVNMLPFLPTATIKVKF